METNTQNEMSINNTAPEANVETSAAQVANVQDEIIDPNDPRHPDHPEHHKHMSALHAAGLTHSAVGHVMPHHRGIDL